MRAVCVREWRGRCKGRARARVCLVLNMHFNIALLLAIIFEGPKINSVLFVFSWFLGSFERLKHLHQPKIHLAGLARQSPQNRRAGIHSTQYTRSRNI